MVNQDPNNNLQDVFNENTPVYQFQLKLQEEIKSGERQLQTLRDLLAAKQAMILVIQEEIKKLNVNALAEHDRMRTIFRGELCPKPNTKMEVLNDAIKAKTASLKLLQDQTYRITAEINQFRNHVQELMGMKKELNTMHTPFLHTGVLRERHLQIQEATQKKQLF